MVEQDSSRVERGGADEKYKNKWAFLVLIYSNLAKNWKNDIFLIFDRLFGAASIKYRQILNLVPDPDNRLWCTSPCPWFRLLSKRCLTCRKDRSRHAGYHLSRITDCLLVIKLASHFIFRRAVETVQSFVQFGSYFVADWNS